MQRCNCYMPNLEEHCISFGLLSASDLCYCSPIDFHNSIQSAIPPLIFTTLDMRITSYCINGMDCTYMVGHVVTQDENISLGRQKPSLHRRCNGKFWGQKIEVGLFNLKRK